MKADLREHNTHMSSNASRRKEKLHQAVALQDLGRLTEGVGSGRVWSISARVWKSRLSEAKDVQKLPWPR